MSSIFEQASENQVLATVAACKRIARRTPSMTLTEIGARAGVTGASVVARYLAWPECSDCETVLREASASGLCGLCEIPDRAAA